MSTRRERMEARLFKRLQWAETRTAKAESAVKTALDMASVIPFGQPILVGHHSEKRDRNYRGRIDGKFRKAAEHGEMAKEHRSKADGIEAQLDGSIFSDDENAVEALRAKIATLEAQQVEGKRANSLYKKGGAKALAEAGIIANTPEAIASYEAGIAGNFSWDKRPVASYTLKNRNATIRQARLRIAQIEKQQARKAKADASGGVLIEGTGDYVRVTFAEKPERSTIEALKAADFSWGGGSWTGRRDALPACVVEAVTS